MPDAPTEDVTRILAAISAGDSGATAQLLPLIYDELRRMAKRKMANEPADHTLQPTALVHEAYLRLVGGATVSDPAPQSESGPPSAIAHAPPSPRQSWQNKAHFFAAAAIAMRRILIERARRRAAHKHGGGRALLSLEGMDVADASESLDLLALDEALSRLEQQDPRMSRIVELRYFAGLSIEETAETLDVSPRTVKRDWTFARAWLYEEITRGE